MYEKEASTLVIPAMRLEASCVLKYSPLFVQNYEFLSQASYRRYRPENEYFVVGTDDVVGRRV